MLRQPVYSGGHLWRVCLMFLALSFSIPATAATTDKTAPKPGAYCPDTGILPVVAEELSASLELAMHSRVSRSDKDRVTAINKLSSAGTTLRLAASRGAAARTTLLIDAIIEAGPEDAYARMLSWFPVLHASLLTLPGSTTVSAAGNLIGEAEDAMQGARDRDPVKLLKEARHLLSCDGLDIPLQAAILAQLKLMKKFGPQVPVKENDYDTLLDPLRDALTYALDNSKI